MADADALGPHDLVITSSTLGNPPFAQLVAAAAGAGIRGLSLWPEPDFARTLASGTTAADMRALLADHGLVANDVDAIVEWVGPDAPTPPIFEEPPRRTLYDAADELGARFANVLLAGPKGASIDDVAAGFARVCDEAAEHGLVATLEFSAGTHAPDLNTARRIVETAGRPNGAILVDAWHLHLGRSTLADLAALPGELAAAVQVNDGPAERPADFAYATRYARLAPGDGTFDLPAFVAKLDAIGCRAPLGIEVFNAPLLDELGPAGLARRLAGSVRALRRRP
ncbi:MAG TPA: TIM barrel protein [Acidimicrobiia bacterium]|nr:TIM barrel protein [Acidimicrobiia bacterium]